MTPDATPPRRETLTQMQRLLAEARPDQIRRLLDDIRADRRDVPETQCEHRRHAAGGWSS